MDEDRSGAPREGAPPRGPESVPLRVAVAWGLGLAATVGAAIMAGVASVVLTTFGLGGVVLAALALLVTIGATAWRRGLLPLAVIALALALPATWAAQAEPRIDRSRGAFVATPRVPAELRAYRRGVGPVLVDLRRFDARPGSTTSISARADAGRLVVALPQDRCFDLDVHFREDALSGAAQFALRAVRATTGEDGLDYAALSGQGLTSVAAGDDSRRAGEAALAVGEGSPLLPYGLLAFNRWPTAAGVYRRVASGEPTAPTLRLDLRSSQQIVIRDYPAGVDPLSVRFSERTGLASGGMAWPAGTPRPQAPVERSPSGNSAIRTPENRARWIAWEDALIAWAKAQAKRAAGPCAAPSDLRARGFSFFTQPAMVRSTDPLLGSGRHMRSTIDQPVAPSADSMLLVEVDGLGDTRLLGVRPRAARHDGPVGP